MSETNFMEVTTELAGNDALSLHALQQTLSDSISVDEYIRTLDALFDPQSTDQWRIISDEIFTQSLTDFDFGVLEEDSYMHRNGPQNVIPKTGMSSLMDATSDNLLSENEALPLNALDLQRRFSDVPFINQNREHVHLQERPISPLLLSGTYPPFPSPYQSEMTSEQHARAVTTIPRLQEEILPFTLEVPRDSVGIDLSHSGAMQSPCNRALQSCWDHSSVSTLFPSNDGAIRLAETYNIMAHPQYLRTPTSPIPITVNPEALFTSTGRGGTMENDHESFHAYIPSLPLRPRSIPRGRPHIRTILPIPHQGQRFKIRCDWEGKCGTYVHADQGSVSRHIRSHIANEMLKAMSGVAISSSNVRYMFNPSHNGLEPQLRLHEVEPEIKVRMLMEGGRVWARRLWGANGCCCSRGELTLEYLPRHVCYMHLGLPRC